MSFLETVELARAFLERNGRVSLRGLKREFGLDDDALDELVEGYCQVSVPRASRYSGSWSQLESGGNRDCIPNEERTTS